MWNHGFVIVGGAVVIHLFSGYSLYTFRWQFVHLVCRLPHEPRFHSKYSLRFHVPFHSHFFVLDTSSTAHRLSSSFFLRRSFIIFTLSLQLCVWSMIRLIFNGCTWKNFAFNLKFRRQLCEGRGKKGANEQQKGQLIRKRIQSCWFILSFSWSRSFFSSSFICCSTLLNFHLHSHSRSILNCRVLWQANAYSLLIVIVIITPCNSSYTRPILFNLNCCLNIFFHISCYMACLFSCRLACQFVLSHRFVVGVFGAFVFQLLFFLFKFTLFDRVFERASNEHIIFH